MDLLDKEPERQRVADSLKLELGIGLAFWLPYALPQGFDAMEAWPTISLVWFAIWMSAPLLTLIGLLMLPRDWRLRWGWLQILAGFAIAATVWWKFSTVELF